MLLLGLQRSDDMGTILGFIVELVRYFADFRSRRRQQKEELMKRLEECRKALSLALEEGRVTDAGMLAEELDELMKKCGRSARKALRSAQKAVAVVSLVCLASLFCGCLAFSGRSKPVLITGERIHIVSPGQAVTVPALVKPAKKWYLVDNVALQHWLKIPMDLGSKEAEHGGNP